MEGDASKRLPHQTHARYGIREITTPAKVSAATVSRTINRIPTADPVLVKRVWRVVDEPGYCPTARRARAARESTASAPESGKRRSGTIAGHEEGRGRLRSEEFQCF